MNKHLPSPEVVTFGCRLNTFESEIIHDHAEKAGLQDTVIFNTCAVTAEARRQARQAIRHLARERPGANIIVTGCAAQLDADGFAAMPEVSRVLGNSEKLEAASFLAGANAAVSVSDIMTVRETAPHLIQGLKGRTRAFVQVQNGCDHRCTFCIIPFARGPNRSVDESAVVEQVKTLVNNGTREVVLTGVDMTSYGGDLPHGGDLAGLVGSILRHVPALERLRISSLDPAEVNEDLLALIGGEERLMPHVHLSLQAGDDMILRRMKRRHSRNQAVELCGELRARRPDIALGTDLIAGFPTETEAMFQNTAALVEDCGLSFLHVFPFSPHPDTPAAHMPEVDGPVIRDRAARLRQLGDAARARFFDTQVGRCTSVLMEKPTEGHSAEFATVRLDRPREAGDIITARVTGHDGKLLLATPSQQAV